MLILDGFGHRKQKRDNAVALAKTPTLNRISKHYGRSLLLASGTAVGLPAGFMGNSEVGHLTLGSGRRQPQALSIVNHAIKTGSFFSNSELIKTIRTARQRQRAVHLMGLVSDNGVHAHENHLFALLKLCRKEKIKQVWIHFFADGRDSNPKTALQYLSRLQTKIKQTKIETIATVIGRFYAMDRDQHWNRTQKAFACIVNARGKKAKNAASAIRAGYTIGLTDEFISPTVLGKYSGLLPDDSVIFFNYRADRARQLSHAFLDHSFFGFARKKPKVLFCAFFPYYKNIPCRIAFEEPQIKHTLSHVISKAGLRQLHIAETEKYAHVTYFFNGENEQRLPGEQRVLIPSKRVRTFDQTPAMRCTEITNRILRELRHKKFDFCVANFSNADLVGHTGNLNASSLGIECMDTQINRLQKAILKHGGALVITADHGNAENKKRVWGGREKQHTTNPVPFWLVTKKRIRIKPHGALQDIAPTILDLLGLSQPKEMTGKSLIQKQAKKDSKN